MNKIARLLGLAVLCAGAVSAQAQYSSKPYAYGELSLTPITSRIEGVDFKSQSLRGLMGYQFHPVFSVEGMVDAGFSPSTVQQRVNNVTLDTSIKVRSMVGAYVRAKTMLAPNFELFGRAGVVHTSLELANKSVLGNTITRDSGSGFSYGAGLNYQISPTTYVGMDLTRYYKSSSSNSSINGIALTVGSRF